VLRQDLDGDGAVEPRVAGLIDLSLSPSPDRGEDFMSAEFIAWLERHITGEVQFSQSENGLRLVDGALGSYPTLTGNARRVEVPVGVCLEARAGRDAFVGEGDEAARCQS
jgi:hypothetical protein